MLGSGQAALSALFKLQRILPRRVAERLGAFADSVVHTPQGPGDPVSTEVLLELADACRHRNRLQMVYCDRAGRRTSREADPHRLVRTRNRWYLVALDVERGQWRTVRADRVVEARPTGQPVRIENPPDAARLVADMLTRDYPLYATVVLQVPLEEAQRLVPPGSGIHESVGAEATRVTLGASDLDELATRLLSLAVSLAVVAPTHCAARCAHASAPSSTPSPPRTCRTDRTASTQSSRRPSAHFRPVIP